MAEGKVVWTSTTADKLRQGCRVVMPTGVKTVKEIREAIPVGLAETVVLWVEGGEDRICNYRGLRVCYGR